MNPLRPGVADAGGTGIASADDFGWKGSVALCTPGGDVAYVMVWLEGGVFSGYIGTSSLTCALARNVPLSFLNREPSFVLDPFAAKCGG